MKLRSIALATVFAACAASPAFAANWDRVGSVDLNPGMDRDSTSPDFGGPVERLRFTARESTLICPSVKATFGNGDRQEIFSGRIQQGDSKIVDLPGNRRTITRLAFKCHSDRSGGRMVIEADAGQYRAQWLRNPTWAKLWNVIADESINYWVYLGQQSFVGNHDSDAMFAGWGGRSVNSIGLRAVSDDARCSRLTVTFGNGTSKSFTPGLIHEDHTYRIDLPGNERNVTRIALKCRPQHDRSVRVNIYANK